MKWQYAKMLKLEYQIANSQPSTLALMQGKHDKTYPIMSH